MSEPYAFSARIVNVLLVVSVGVPDIVPVLESSARPSGSEPLLTDHVIGFVPDASRVAEYAVFSCASGG